MLRGKRHVWCNEGDNYETVSYDEDTPCRKSGRLFLLKDATREDGDFQVYTGSGWHGPVSIESKNATFLEQMYLNFYFPVAKWDLRPSDECIERVRQAVERALKTDEFKNEVEGVLENTKVSVVARTNAYYGD